MSLYQKVVITGAGGMLGHALQDLLRTRGVEPLALTRAQCDLTRDADIEAIFAHEPTLVLNCAAHTKVDQCEQEIDLANRINGYAVGKLADGCQRTKAALVHVSTDFVFDGSVQRPYRVDDAVNPLSAYGKSKLLGETQLQANAPSRWLIVRTAWVYGRHGANFPRTMVTVAKAGKPLNVVADQVGAPTYTPDLARAILSLLDSEAQGVFHVTNSGQTNWREFAQATLKQFGIEHEVGSLTTADWVKLKPNSAVCPLYTALDISDFERQTGKPLRPWRDALADFHKEVEAAGSF